MIAGEDLSLDPDRLIQQDLHWTMKPRRMPNLRRAVQQPAINPATRRVAPQLLKCKVYETMRRLTTTELNRHFAPATGILALTGIKVWINPEGQYICWASWVRQMRVDGDFFYRPDLSNEKVKYGDRFQKQCET